MLQRLQQLRLALVIISNLTICSITYSDSFIVSNTKDTDAGSLSQAIIDAGDNAGADTIVFNIPQSDSGYESDNGIWRIQFSSSIPEVLGDSTLIDGYSQANFIGSDTNPLGPEIVIDGSGDSTTYGFSIFNSNNELRGLTIHQFAFDLIVIHSDSNRIRGCYIGPDATGMNRLPNETTGISIYGSYNIIGGTAVEDRNIISGNVHNGIIFGSGASNNRIEGNYIGLNSSGTDTLSNYVGIRISGHSKKNIIGPGNVISGNLSYGLTCQISSDSNRVIGNFIGTDPTGTLDFGNGSNGIFITGASSSNIIGGNIEGHRNIISGNGYFGVNITKSNSDSNLVIGNYVGTDITGSVAIPNEGGGIVLNSGSTFSTIGGQSEGERNLISGNMKSGVLIRGVGTKHNHVIGNLIGVSADGSTPLQNEEHGVNVQYTASENMIGPSNVIAFNGGNGVHIYDSEAIKNTVTQNSIYNNSGEGIFNGGLGNQGIEAPVITSVMSGAEGTTIPSGFVEIFSDSGGQGRIFETGLLADSEGNFTWPGSPVGPFVTTTVTDDSGNTSAFSEQLMLRVERAIGAEKPSDFGLSQNYPNPFNPETKIHFSVKERCHVSLQIYNVLGQKIRTLANKQYEPGMYRINFNSKGLTSGIYFYTIQMENFRATRKMVILE